MLRRGTKKVLSSDSEDDQPLSKLKKSSNEDDSSSDSDIENYLQPINKIDLNSEFFKVEKEIFNGVQRLESESESDNVDAREEQPSTSRYNFTQLHEYSKKIQDAKKHLEQYQARNKTKQEENLNVTNLLALGESSSKVEEKTAETDADSDDDVNNWEEVIDFPKIDNLEVKIEIPGANNKKRRDKEVDLMAVIKRRINRVKKENQVLVHKVHLLCWIAHGNSFNTIINKQNVLGMALSLLPSDKCYPANRTDLNYLEQILKWYRKTIELSDKQKSHKKSLEDALTEQIAKRRADNKNMLVYIFIGVMRALGIQCRLVLSLQLEPLRPPNSELLSLSTNTENSNNKKDSKNQKETIKKASKNDNSVNKKKTTKNSESKSKKVSRKSRIKIPQVDGANDKKTKKPNLKKLSIKTRNSKNVTKYCDSESEDDFDKNRNVRQPVVILNRMKNSHGVTKDIVKIVKSSMKRRKSDDSDYMPEVIKKKAQDSDDDFAHKVKVKRRIPAKPQLEEKKKRIGNDVWAEVFLELEEKWISVDVVKGEVHCVKELATRASAPISYVIAWNNNNTIKDISKRYCTNFNTVTRKLRVDSDWWDKTLKPYLPIKTAREREEDDEFERQQLEKPLPTTISEYKNHPLYVIKRHLLKFEVLYPEEPPALGFIRGEPVYSRQCVFICHSRDIWLKHAKVVKPGEQPYKIVKARPKWDKLSNSMITDQLLEIFGPWQTQDYVPPTAENGKVPRNAFGNVELFKDCMLPKGTVHLKLHGLNKVARRLQIDCAPALVGFDFHGGWNHPTYDGYIVCEEFAKQLEEEWEKEQEELDRKEQEKIDKRVYGNWKKLIRGLLIRERLKAKYEFGGATTSGDKTKKKKKK